MGWCSRRSENRGGAPLLQWGVGYVGGPPRADGCAEYCIYFLSLTLSQLCRHKVPSRMGRICARAGYPCPGRCTTSPPLPSTGSRFFSICARRVLISALREAQVRGDATTLAFVIMPDHMHWLMQLEGATALSNVVGAVKAVTAHGLGGRIWQSGFHDHALRQEEDLAKLARYIVANPLRAGLVQRIGDYPHWDAVWL